MKHTRSLSAAVLLTMAALLGPATPANAYSGTGWDGTDPNKTGCDKAAITPVNVKWIRNFDGGDILGAVELRFASNCLTAWARLTAEDTCGQVLNAEWLGCGEAYVERDKGSPSEFRSCKIAKKKYKCWSKQIYDGPGFKAHAAGYLPTNAASNDLRGSGPTGSY